MSAAGTGKGSVPVDPGARAFRLAAGSLIGIAFVAALVCGALLLPDRNYAIVLLVGVLVGSTELMSRYRDAPFLPLLSAPGIFYVVLNGGAAVLAYFLLGVLLPDQFLGTDAKTQVSRVLLASLGAMSVFRSGIFTLRLGDSDVAIGPNLILQVLLSALDRAYDRLRAAPRSTETARIMAGVSFKLAAPALPSFCFNLMQNVSEDERNDIADEIESLNATEMSDEARTLVLGLRLFNVVGPRTLEQAVEALGGTIRGFNKLDISTLANLAKQQDVAGTVAALPQVVRALCHEQARHVDDDKIAEIHRIAISDDAKALLLVHALVRHYGQDVVNNALESLMLTSPPPAPPATPTPPVTPSGS